MSRFVAWNDLLLSEFFSAASENEDVWICATRAELDSFGLHLGGAQGLVDAVASSAPWLSGSQANCSEAARLLVQQRRSSLRSLSYRDPEDSNPNYAGAKAPTYLPILALWVLAASGEQLEGGFYASVEDLLGQPFRNVPRVTAAMSEAWEDLEIWSVSECVGRFGNFHCRVLGEYRFVGVPRSQCLISRYDERNLYKLFWEFRLRPGQNLPESTLTALLDRGSKALFLTKPLRSAMEKREYAAPLAALLRKLLGSWSGLPRAGQLDAAERGDLGLPAKDYSEGGATVTLVLSPSDEVANGWDIRWRFPAIVDAPGCTFEFAGQRQSALLHRPSAFFLTELSDFAVRQSANALSASTMSRVDVTLRFEDDGDGTCSDQFRKELIGHAVRRILVWNSIDPRFGQQLIERDIPLYGVFYVICGPSDWRRTEAWLLRERIIFESMSPYGLPTGWGMACIHKAETLKVEHRQHLADAPEAQDVPPARLRLVGGSRLLRGGTRLFAAYDLPDIEVESPPGSHIEAAGLRLVEVQLHLLGVEQSGLRRFVIDVLDHSRSSFEIKVTSNGIKLAMVPLRVADPDGEGRGEMRNFSLTPLGLSQSNLGGLRGVRIGGAPQDQLADSWRDEEMLDVAAAIDLFETAIVNSAAAQFLDTLASRGSMSYGASKDQFSRLSCGANAVPLLMNLRARGCLEIETDGKGHFVRIHSAVPTLFGLPAKKNGLPLFGVGGTLRLVQWSMLQSIKGVRSSIQGGAAGNLPALRLAAMNTNAVEDVCRLMGFQFAPGPARDLASWSGSLREARVAAESGGAESVAAELGHLHRLKANSARFVPTSAPHLTIDRESRAQLFRFDDPQAAALQLYVLGVRRADGASRYSHVHDSRWGVWISQLAFAEMLKERHGRNDAFPWPLHYDPGTRDVWIPARLRPPVVLERALALCSGREPEIHFLSPGDFIGDGVQLIDRRSGRVAGTASLVYGEFVPCYWLRYSWVPVGMARQLAGLLDSTLEPFASAGMVSDFEITTI